MTTDDDAIEAIRRQVATSRHPIDDDVRTLLAALDAARAKSRELNRRAQSAASEARKEYAREAWGEARHRRPLWRAGQLLGVAIDGLSWAAAEEAIVAAIDAARAEAQRERERAEAACDLYERALTQRDTARREAIEEAIEGARERAAATESFVGEWARGWDEACGAALRDLRALLDEPAVEREG